MSDLIWYSRLAVWAGALVLLSQAVTGHGPSFMTLLGVLCLTVGFAAFLSGLVLDGRPSGVAPNSEAAQASPPQEQDGGSAPPSNPPLGGPSKP